jgi:aryl-alcohol dehydrogenase-like predicted oxidoreductase
MLCDLARRMGEAEKYRDAGFYRSVLGLNVSSLGIGTYMGGVDDAADRAYTDALLAAGESGINFFDAAINYRNQRSERCIGAALKRLQRDETVICTKAGFLTPGAQVRRRPGRTDGGRGVGRAEPAHPGRGPSSGELRHRGRR